MHLTLSVAYAFTALGAALVEAQNSSSAQSDPYVPNYTECPNDLSVRNASDGLSDKEKAWRRERAREIKTSLESYLKNANISGFDVSSYIDKLDTNNVPIVGLTISGGGTQSGIGGLGIWQAFDDRYPRAVSAGTGGLTQILSYVTGLSGGGAVTVSILATNDFDTVEEIAKATNFSKPYDDPTDKEGAFYFENAGAKAESGFPVSVTDVFGQFWATWLPEDWTYASYSDIATNATAFKSGRAPMPIVTLAEVIPGLSPEIGKIPYPGFNETNLFNLTSYEVTPYEFGSWLGGRVQAFMSTEYLGTAMSEGKVQNKSECVQGLDKMSFVQGSTTDAFCAWLIDDFYKIPIFAKRQDQPSSGYSDDIDIPEDQYENPLVQLVNETASNFEQSFSSSLWSTYPNPFENYNERMKNESELLLVDGSLTGENNPIRPLIVPERDVNFIIVYEASSEGKYSWMNGTSLQNTAKAASLGNIPFPKIPNVDTMITQNFTSQPTFFGCDATEDTPLVLYLPNSPWSSYSNFSYMQGSFTDEQLNSTLENAFQLATYGNGTIDANWPSCLACATIKRSLDRMSMDMPEQCSKCFDQHCWNGEESNATVTEADLDLRLRLYPGLSYADWNKTSEGGGKSESSNKTSGDGGPAQEDATDAASVKSDRASMIALVCVAVSILFLA